MGSIPYWGTKIPYAMEHTTIHPESKQTNNKNTTLDRPRHLPMGNATGTKAGNWPSKLKGTEALVVLMRSSKCSPSLVRWMASHVTLGSFIFTNQQECPHLIHFCLLAIRCSSWIISFPLSCLSDGIILSAAAAVSLVHTGP